MQAKEVRYDTAKYYADDEGKVSLDKASLFRMDDGWKVWAYHFKSDDEYYTLPERECTSFEIDRILHDHYNSIYDYESVLWEEFSDYEELEKLFADLTMYITDIRDLEAQIASEMGESHLYEILDLEFTVDKLRVNLEMVGHNLF